jgi:integrase/recombinase XerD
MQQNKKGGKRLQKRTVNAVDKLLNDYSQYLYKRRGLTQRTIIDYCKMTKKFLLMIESKKLTINQIQPKHVIKFILDIKSSDYAQRMTTTLRSFFRYLKQTNKINSYLDNILLPIADRKKIVYPEVLSPKHIFQLLNCCDRTTIKGMRDYAILVLLISLGLRGCEVSNINLDDINLHNAEITIRGKGSIRRMPLFKEVGEALMTYIEYGRPNIVSNKIFITLDSPFRAITVEGIRSMFRCILKSIGLLTKKQGTHLLRHTFAMQLLKRGATLPEIGIVLGHKSLDTTAVYARADFDSLKSIALPWPLKTKKRGKL